MHPVENYFRSTGNLFNGPDIDAYEDLRTIGFESEEPNHPLALLSRFRQGDFAAADDLIRTANTYQGNFLSDYGLLCTFAAPSPVLLELSRNITTESEISTSATLRSDLVDVLLPTNLPAVVDLLFDYLSVEEMNSVSVEGLEYLLLIFESDIYSVLRHRLLSTQNPSIEAWGSYFSQKRKELVEATDEQWRPVSISRTAILFGNPINIPLLVRLLLEEVIPSNIVGLFTYLRITLEAYTGYDLSPCYQDGAWSRQRSAQCIEEMVETIDIEQFAVGRRYFFGNPIPE